MTSDYKLTTSELMEMDTLLSSLSIDLEQPVEPLKGVTPKTRYVGSWKPGDGVLGAHSYEPGSLLILEQRGMCKLSDETRRREEDRLAAVTRKKRGLRFRKRYTRKRGHVHPKKKEATQRRNRQRNWAHDAFSCVLNMDTRKCKRIDRAKWKELIDPLWELYDPNELKVIFPRLAGTRANPWTLYNMDIVHSKIGRVYRGEDQLLYDLSK